MQYLWGESVSACICLLVSPRLDQPVSRVPMGRVRGPGNWPGVWDRQRGHPSIRGIHWSVCSCESREYWVCAVNSELQSLPAKEEEGTWLSVLVLTSVLHVGDVEGKTLSVSACVAGHVGVHCVHLGYTLSVTTNWTCKWESRSCVHWPGVEISGSPGRTPGAGRKSYWAPKLLGAVAASEIP